MTSLDGGRQWADIAAAYREVANDYATTFADELNHKPFDRALLREFARAASHQATGRPAGSPVVIRRPVVADLGCGPGHVGAFVGAAAPGDLHVIGVDLSPEMVLQGRRCFPNLAFAVGDLRRLPLADGVLAAALCFYSLIHLQRVELPGVFGELSRVLSPGGQLLIAVHGGNGDLHDDRFLGHEVHVSATLFQEGELQALCERAGLSVVRQQQRQPYEEEFATPRLYTWAEKAGGGHR